MITQCPSCQKSYRIDETKLNQSSISFKCKQCSQPIRVEKPVMPDFPKPANVKRPLDMGEDGDGSGVENSSDMTVKLPPLVSDGLFKRMKLRTKLNLAMIGIFIICITCIFFLAGHRMEKTALKQVYAKSRLLLTTMESSRHFTSKVIKPSLYEVIPFKFVVEGMSSAAGQQSIFDEFRALYPKYYFKLAVPKPRNPVNTPNDFEMNIISDFRMNSDLKQWSGYTQIDGKKYFIVMEPIVAGKSCLRCHSTPKAAPPELNRRYATWYGFGLKRPDDIYGALTVTVPASVVALEAKKNTMVFIGLVTIFFAVLIMILNVLFGRVVIKPIKLLSKNANAISVGNLDTEIDTSGKDEISQLAKSFERMRTSVKLAFDRLKKQRSASVV